MMEAEQVCPLFPQAEADPVTKLSLMDLTEMRKDMKKHWINTHNSPRN
jgi:hypothetical protein